MTKRRWIEYLIAVLAGNAMYFAVLYPGLPASLQHQPYRFDAGLAIDFACCVLVYTAIRLGTRHAARWNTRLSARGTGRSGPGRTESSRPRTDAPSGSRPSG